MQTLRLRLNHTQFRTLHPRDVFQLSLRNAVAAAKRGLDFLQPVLRAQRIFDAAHAHLPRFGTARHEFRHARIVRLDHDFDGRTGGQLQASTPGGDCSAPAASALPVQSHWPLENSVSTSTTRASFAPIIRNRPASGQKLWVRVRAVNDLGPGPWSDPVCCMIG